MGNVNCYLTKGNPLNCSMYRLSEQPAFRKPQHLLKTNFFEEYGPVPGAGQDERQGVGREYPPALSIILTVVTSADLVVHSRQKSVTEGHQVIGHRTRQGLGPVTLA